jgi:DeoR family suf operon transcriptional repressor
MGLSIARGTGRKRTIWENAQMQSTRQRILEILKERKRATVEQLSKELALTAVTVRHHLDILRGEGLVAPPEVLHRSGPGRPQYIYGLTEAASDFFPKNYGNLADLMLDEIRERVSTAELEKIVKGVAERMAAQAPDPQTKKRPRQILDAAVRFLNQQGYVASWERLSDGRYLMHTCNCPYERVAQVHHEVCQMDAQFVGELVGGSSQRLSHMAKGDSTCSYVVDFSKV